MNRRKFLTALGTIAPTALAGCTMTSQNGTDNSAGTTATSEIEDGIFQIDGEAWYDCHSGYTDELVVGVDIVADGEVVDTLETVVDVEDCGYGYEYSLTYKLSSIEQDWTTISVDSYIIVRR